MAPGCWPGKERRGHEIGDSSAWNQVGGRRDPFRNEEREPQAIFRKRGVRKTGQGVSKMKATSARAKLFTSAPPPPSPQK